MSLTPYQRIMRAAGRGSGCRLSAEDCQAMSADHAIFELASRDDERAGLPDDEAAHFDCFEPGTRMGKGWCAGDGWYRCRECSKFDAEEAEASR